MLETGIPLSSGPSSPSSTLSVRCPHLSNYLTVTGVYAFDSSSFILKGGVFIVQKVYLNKVDFERKRWNVDTECVRTNEHVMTHVAT